jgi:putative membrane protein
MSAGKETVMSTRRLIATAGALAVAFTAAPIALLHSQVPAKDTAFRPGPGGGQPTSTVPGRAGVTADSAFIREASAGNVLEVRLGNLAQGKATNSEVKQFAQRMVTDHTQMEKQWNALAGRNGLPPAALDPAQAQDVIRLEKLSGAEFDRAYMTTMIQDHQHDADAFRSQGLSAHSAEVRQLAATGLTTIQQHLSMALQVGSTVGASTPVAVLPQAPPAPQAPQPTATNQNGQVAPQPVKGGSADVKADRKFIQEVAAGNMMEIRLGQLAQQKATGSDARRLADRLVADFTRWQDRWTGMASRNGMPFKPGMGDLHRQKVERLQKASRGQFDRVYVRTVIENLESMLPYFQKEGRAARSAPVRNLVEEELPALQQDLAMAKRIGEQVHADKTDPDRDRDRDRDLSKKK